MCGRVLWECVCVCGLFFLVFVLLLLSLNVDLDCAERMSFVIGLNVRSAVFDMYSTYLYIICSMLYIHYTYHTLLYITSTMYTYFSMQRLVFSLSFNILIQYKYMKNVWWVYISFLFCFLSVACFISIHVDALFCVFFDFVCKTNDLNDLVIIIFFIQINK